MAAQIGALFKRNGPGSPTHRLKVRRVFESGFSQDGGFTFTQADVFNALERLPRGGPVYDGYVPGGTTGPSNIDFGLTPAGALPAGDPRYQMRPRDVPVIHINTETEEAALAGPAGLTYRRPDGNARNDRYRLWEVPGASHVSNDLDSSPLPATIVRDGFGNALGGLRTPFVDVSTATYSPTDTVSHPTVFSPLCILFGYGPPFNHAALRSLYRSHGAYVARVARESRRLVRDGFWLRPDAEQVVRQAAHADVP